MIGLWAAQLRQGIYQPFRPKNSGTSENAPAVDNQLSEQADTDKDGLLDVDETGAYGTSPYLEDTDGDNINDGAEVRAGTDPNCPEGNKCGAPTTSGAENGTTSAAIISDAATSSPAAKTATPASQTDSSAGGLSEQDMKNMLEGKMSASALRQALLKSGADPKLLDQLSDEDLVSSYKKSLNSQ